MSKDEAHKPRRHYPAIPLKVLFHIVFLGVMNKKLRSTLTIMGVVVGIGAIYFMLSFGLGLQLVVSKQIIGDKSIKSIEVSTPNSRIIKLNDAAVNKIRTYPHVERVGSLYSYPGSVSSKGSEVSAIMYGVDEGYVALTPLNLVKGRLINDKDVNVALINRITLKSIGATQPEKAIGTKLTLNIPLANIEDKKGPIKDSFEIVGVVDSGGGNEIYIPGHIYKSAGVSALSQLKLTADDTSNITPLRKQVESNGFQTVSPVDTLDQINKVFKFFNIMLLGFGAVGMVVSVLGMFNTLTISLIEKTQEVGLMIALGGRRADMRRLFIIEATLLAAVGAFIGIAGATVHGYLVDAYLNRLAHKRGVTNTFTVFSRPLWLTLGLFTFMVIVGLIVVYFPARRAEKINPIDALKRE